MFRWTDLGESKRQAVSAGRRVQVDGPGESSTDLKDHDDTVLVLPLYFFYMITTQLEVDQHTLPIL